MPSERLARWLARSGVASRRSCDRLVEEGRVTVNGRMAPPSGLLIDPEVDVVTVDGQTVTKGLLPRRYLALNKPAGVVVHPARGYEGGTLVNGLLALGLFDATVLDDPNTEELSPQALDMLKRLKDMEASLEAGETERMSKKEALLFEREMAKLVKSIGGVKDMGGIPDAIFVVDVGYHKIAVTEAKKLGIPVIAVVDTNHSPEGIDYVIPGNDDASKAVMLYTKGVADAILEGRSSAVNEVVQAVRSGDGDDFVEVNAEA